MIFSSAYILLIIISWIILYKAEKITQVPLMDALEGKGVKFSCSHPSAQSDTIFWYQQFPNQGLRYIVSAYNNEEKSDILKNVSLVVSKDKKSSILSFTRATLEDSAMYYCALSDDNFNTLPIGSGTRLTVLPNLEPSFPSVYKLKPFSEEKQGKAACLFTDYSPNPLKVSINKEGTKEVNGSVVVVKEDQSASGTASYGIVLWGNADDNFQCHVDAENPKGDSGISPQVIQAEEDGVITFETDERLNLLSLTVLGLRVIFLKTVAFNLLFTFRLWSR